MQGEEGCDDILCSKTKSQGSDRLPPIEASLRTRCGATTRTWFACFAGASGLRFTLIPGWPEPFSTLEP
jgi:hypothetical protein